MCIRDRRKAVPGLRSVVLNTNTRSGNAVLGETMRTLWGDDAIEDILCGLRFRISPRSFYQVNRKMCIRDRCEFDGARLTSLSLRGRFAPVAISQSPVETLESLRRKRKPFHRDSFCQNVFDISGKGGYNKDVETRTVATTYVLLDL